MNERYRNNVAAIVRNADGLLLTGERRDIPGQWQLPQGGIDGGETPEEALWRELEEETGLRRDRLILRQSAGPFSYRFPEHTHYWRGFIGQRQHYFLLDIIDDSVVAEPSEEFIGWMWLTPSEVYKRVIDFKKAVYRQAFTALLGEDWPNG